MRREKDSMGEMELPEERYYGIQTERAKQNFSISGQEIGHYRQFLFTLACIKKCAALANREIGVLSKEIADAICVAADEVMVGKMDREFVVDVFQGGGQTSTNMNMNEVIANRANEIVTGHKGYDQVHPNNHVNMCQSTNDVIPSALKISSYSYLNGLIEEIDAFQKTLQNKTEEFVDVVMVGKTCLQDALPITLGQRLSAYLAFIQRQKCEVRNVMKDCLVIPLGATAIGTGLGALPGYTDAIYKYLPFVLNLPVKKDPNFFDGLQNGDIYIRISGVLKGLASGLAKMASDLRILSSGPRIGFGEIRLPAVQPGSSIMPGKVNPVIPEMVIQVCYQVYGNDLSLSMAVEGGELDLNVWESIIMKCLFESCQILANSIKIFDLKCIAGIEPDHEVCRRHADSSLALVTALSPIIGYEKASEIYNKALLENKSIKQLVVERNILAESQADGLLDPKILTNNDKINTLLSKIQLNS